MGAILSLIRNTPSEPIPPFCVPLRCQEPTPADKELYDQAAFVLNPNKQHLENIQHYQGCQEFIRKVIHSFHSFQKKAISKPGKESENEAWNALIPAISQLKSFYEHSNNIRNGITFSHLETLFIRMMKYLATNNAQEKLSGSAAIVSKLAELLYFVVQFDDAKMKNSHLQNDFSYYRRQMGKTERQGKLIVQEELANRMSFFYAHATPMLKVLLDSLSTDSSTELCECFYWLICIFYNNAVEIYVNDHAKKEECLRNMVICVVMYDHISPSGAFSKNSRLQLISLIKAFDGLDPGVTMSLKSNLKYSSLHYNDETTHQSIKNLLES